MQKQIGDRCDCGARINDPHLPACLVNGRADSRLTIDASDDKLETALAAARDMLAALKAVQSWWINTPGFEDGEDEMPADIFDGMRDAIAAAEAAGI